MLERLQELKRAYQDIGLNAKKVVDITVEIGPVDYKVMTPEEQKIVDEIGSIVGKLEDVFKIIM